jgi:hypothetical protein
MPLENHYKPPTTVSPEIMNRIRNVIRTMETPSWLASVPANFGDASAGTLKAAEWRALATVYLPVALVSLWGEGSTHATPEAARSAREVLDHTMLLISAAILICYRSSTLARAQTFLDYLLAYTRDLGKIHKGVNHHPNHHMALHLYEFVLLYGPVRNWWTFPFERLIGTLQRLPQNHHFRDIHVTMSRAFIRGGKLKRLLASSRCPEILHLCKRIFNRAFGLDYQDDSSSDTSCHSIPSVKASKKIRKQRTPDDLKTLVQCDYISLRARFRYNGYSFTRGKSLINFYPSGRESSSTPIAGSISYIFDTLKGSTVFAVRRQLPVPASIPDPFRHYPNFPAKLYSHELSDTLEIVMPEWVMGDVARWQMTPTEVVIVSLSRVRVNFSFVPQYLIISNLVLDLTIRFYD